MIWDIPGMIGSGVRLYDTNEIIKSQIAGNEDVPIAHMLWSQIFDTADFNKDDIKFKDKELSRELTEAIRIFYYLRKSDWDATRTEKYTQAAKAILWEIGNKLSAQPAMDYEVHPELRSHLQDMIHWLEEDEQFKDRADLSTIKTKISWGLLRLDYIHKHEFGADMLQFAKHFAEVDLIEKAKEAYNGIIADFEPAPKNEAVEHILKGVTKIELPHQDLKLYVYEKAVHELNKINGVESKEPEYQILDSDMHLRKMVLEEEANAPDPVEKVSIFKKITKLFK